MSAKALAAALAYEPFWHEVRVMSESHEDSIRHRKGFIPLEEYGERLANPMQGEFGRIGNTVYTRE